MHVSQRIHIHICWTNKRKRKLKRLPTYSSLPKILLNKHAQTKNEPMSILARTVCFIGSTIMSCFMSFSLGITQKMDLLSYNGLK